jgi:hypothetical protein
MDRFTVAGAEGRFGVEVADGAKALGDPVRGLVVGVHVADEGRQEREAPVARGAGGLGGVAVAACVGRQVPAELRFDVIPFDGEMDEADGRRRARRSMVQSPWP